MQRRIIGDYVNNDNNLIKTISLHSFTTNIMEVLSLQRIKNPFKHKSHLTADAVRLEFPFALLADRQLTRNTNPPKTEKYESSYIYNNNKLKLSWSFFFEIKTYKSLGQII